VRLQFDQPIFPISPALIVMQRENALYRSRVRFLRSARRKERLGTMRLFLVATTAPWLRGRRREVSSITTGMRASVIAVSVSPEV